LVLFTNGDKFIGEVKDGKKNGLGMYVYADGSAFKGQWTDDQLEGQRHPVDPEADDEDLRRLHAMNEKTAQAVATLKQRLATEKKQTPPVYALQH